MLLSDNSIPDFLSLLSSNSPVPGGGGASALVGAVGISLGSMVGALTQKNPKYSFEESEICKLVDRAEFLKSQLVACIDSDAEVFEPLSKAYRLPKESPNRSLIMEECLKNAASVPMKIMQLCSEAIELHGLFAEKGSRMAISDVATGVVFCLSALEGAAVNVRINTKYMKNREYAEAMNTKVEHIRKIAREKAECIFTSIYKGALQ